MVKLIGTAVVEGQALALPSEIPMHKVKKALVIMGRMQDVKDAIAAVENPISRECIQIEFDTAPNLVLGGASTQLIMAAIGMGEPEKQAMAELALSLP